MRQESIINLEDRGSSLKFRIREMPASRLESWIFRAYALLPRLEEEGEDGLEALGRRLYASGVKALAAVEPDKSGPLLDELLACCTRISGTGVEQVCVPGSVDGFVQDARTLLALREEALKVNLFFFGAEAERTSDKPSGGGISCKTNGS